MATSAWVVNASPVILLGKIERLDLLTAVAGQVAVPQAVVEEVGAKRDGGRILRALVDLPLVATISTTPVGSDLLGWNLGPGETQVISHAMASGSDRVVLDDLQARRCATVMGLRPIGTLGIVGRAKAKGLIERAEPLVTRLRQVGLYVTDELVQRLLREVGEA